MNLDAGPDDDLRPIPKPSRLPAFLFHLSLFGRCDQPVSSRATIMARLRGEKMTNGQEERRSLPSTTTQSISTPVASSSIFAIPEDFSSQSSAAPAALTTVACTRAR